MRWFPGFYGHKVPSNAAVKMKKWFPRQKTDPPAFSFNNRAFIFQMSNYPEFPRGLPSDPRSVCVLFYE